jgi:hypothetical protein
LITTRCIYNYIQVFVSEQPESKAIDTSYSREAKSINKALGDLSRRVFNLGLSSIFVISDTIVFICLFFVIPRQGRLPWQPLRGLSRSSLTKPSELTRKMNLQTRKPLSFRPCSIQACITQMRRHVPSDAQNLTFSTV